MLVRVGEEDVAENSIFSSILADIDANPTILSPKISIVSATLADIVEEKKIGNKKLKTNKRKRSPTDLSFTASSQTLITRSDFVVMLNQELKLLKSEIKARRDRFPSTNPSCDCVEEGKTEQRQELWFLADEVISKADLKTKSSINDSFDEMLSSMLEDEEDGDEVNNSEFIEEMLQEIEKNGDYVCGGLLEDLLRHCLREKQEKEISSWISCGESVAQEKPEALRKKESPKKAKSECEQESSVTKRDYFAYKRRLYLIEKLREGDEKLMEKRFKAVRFGVELSFLVAENLFLIPNQLLVCEIENYLICLSRCGISEDDKEATSVIITKLKEVFEVVITKKEHHGVSFPESVFLFADDNIRLSADAIRILGKIVWSLRRSNRSKRLKLCDLDSLFEDCHKVLVKIELKLAETKERMYRSVSADYESFSRSERFDSCLRRKLMKRVNADSSFERSVIGSYVVEIWKSLFQSEALDLM